MTINEVIGKIGELKREYEVLVTEQSVDGLRLSGIQSLLSIYLGDLGDVLASLSSQVDNEDTALELKRIDAYLKFRGATPNRDKAKWAYAHTETDSKELSKQSVGEERIEIVKKKGNLEKLKKAYEGTKTLIISVQVYLNQIKSDRINSGLEGK